MSSGLAALAASKPLSGCTGAERRASFGWCPPESPLLVLGGLVTIVVTVTSFQARRGSAVSRQTAGATSMTGHQGRGCNREAPVQSDH